MGCSAAGQPHGANLVVHGDGTRHRQIRGPETADGKPVIGTVRVRRYECQRCGTCMLVVPRELLPRRMYTASAIALALALWAIVGMTETGVRARVCPHAVIGTSAYGKWATLRRWARDTRDGCLFGSGRAPPAEFTLRKHAERAAAALLALAPRASLSSSSWAAAFVAGPLHGR